MSDLTPAVSEFMHALCISEETEMVSQSKEEELLIECVKFDIRLA